MDAVLRALFRRGPKRSSIRQLLILLKPNARTKVRRVLRAFSKNRLDASTRWYLLEGLLGAARYWRDNAEGQPQRIAQNARRLLDSIGDDERTEFVTTLEAIATPKRKHGRGGDRKSGTKKPETHLIRILIGLYDRADVFRRAGRGGRRTGWGGPLQRFVRAGLEAIHGGKLPSDNAIKNAFESMKADGVLKSKR
jgi:hypothetical protein